MIKLNQNGGISGLAISEVLTVLLLLGAIGFGFWAYGSRQDYKDNVDAKVNTAVNAAVKTNSAQKEKEFAEAEKNPLKTYNGPEAAGSLAVQFPKTWSGYVASSTSNGGNNLDVYFAPGVVPPVGDQNSIFALHVQVVSQSYANTLQSYNGQQQSGQATISAYALPKVPKAVGVKVTGQVSSQQTQATIIALPLRSQTLLIETDGTQFLNDFNNYILPNFSFLP
jgi:hypothetical protein